MIALAWVMNASLTVAQLQWLIAPWPDTWPWRNGLLPAEIATTIGGGLLGGYAMFSTASIETIRLAKKTPLRRRHAQWSRKPRNLHPLLGAPNEAAKSRQTN